MVVLFEEKRSDIDILVTVKINREGSLIVEGRDSGTRVKELKDVSEYEYALSLLKQDKEKLISRLRLRGKTSPMIRV